MAAYAIKIEVNEACDLRCRMCYVPKGTRSLALPSIASLFEELRGLRTRIEILGGEPLLREDLPEIIARAKAVGLPFVSLYTNGTRATPALARRLRQAGLDAALVTLVSHRSAVHDAFTGRPGSWARTVEGIRARRRGDRADPRAHRCAARSRRSFRAHRRLPQSAPRAGALSLPDLSRRGDPRARRCGRAALRALPPRPRI